MHSNLTGGCESMSRKPSDHVKRKRIECELDRTFLVEAGAGSGKTHSLARRMAAGLANGTYRIDQLAAVTFTRKAAAELRGRLQLALEERLKSEPPLKERIRVESALRTIDQFFAGTIHSFCARLLRERPIEAHVAPGFVELDDVEDQWRRKQAWRNYVTRERGSGSPLMAELQAAKVKPSDLDQAFSIVCEHDEVEFPPGDGEPPDAAPAWRALDHFSTAIAKLLPNPVDNASTCRVQRAAANLKARVAMVRRSRPGELADLLAAWEGDFNTTKKWWGDGRSRGNQVAARVDSLLENLRDVAHPWLESWRQYVYRLAITALIAARQSYAAERRRDNLVNYTDLLCATAALLRTNPEVRRAMQQKYRWILVDEFQDTDPIQAELLVLLAADESSITSPFDANWSTVRLRSGALFVVGDPKQSIYRFRRADIDIYNKVRDLVVASGGEVLSLTACWRSLPEVCTLTNTVFPSKFPASPAPEAPQFEALHPVRESVSRHDQPSGVATLTISSDIEKSEVAEVEAARIAAYIKAEVASGRRRYGDFLILNRGKPGLGFYARALEQCEIPIEVSGAGMFVASPEVATLCQLLTCLADPLDSVSLVGVLRGPLFGVSDRELFEYRRSGGRFEMTAPIAGLINDGVKSDRAQSALQVLQKLYGFTRTLPMGAALERILDDTGFLALAATKADGAGAGALLQAVDRVRQISELGGSLAEAAEAIADGAALSTEIESLPLEPGRQDVVRVMNLHRVKGLEAPVVFLADPCHGFSFPPDVRVIREAGRSRGFMKIEWRSEETYAKRLIGEPAGWRTHEADEQRYIDAEVTRLLYMAATRARDLLVVSQWAKPNGNKAWGDFAAYVSQCPELVVSELPPDADRKMPDCSDEVRAQAGALREKRTARLLQASWTATRATDEAHERGPGSRIRRAMVAEPNVAVSAGSDDAAILRETASHRADSGYAWGLLIHGLLEHAMRHKNASRADLKRLALWLTVESTDLRPHLDQALDVVDSVSTAEFWREAQGALECHVEVPFAILESRSNGVPAIVHGVIDLIYKPVVGWRLLDYKTDQTPDTEQLQNRYSSQIKLYRTAWARVTTAAAPAGGLYAIRTGDFLGIAPGEDTSQHASD
jgi:ATP-dependent helicase/nuclease subunit A